MASWAWRPEAGLARRTGYGVLLGGAAALLAWSGWSGPLGSPYTVISRIDVVVTVGLLAGVPWLMTRKFGPGARTGLSRTIRVAGCAAVIALMLVKTHVERSESPRPVWIAGTWAGEAIFLLIIAAYIAGVFAVTARHARGSAGSRSAPARVAARESASLILYSAAARGSSLNLPSGWLASGYEIARVLAVPLVVTAAVMAGMKAARRSARA